MIFTILKGKGISLVLSIGFCALIAGCCHTRREGAQVSSSSLFVPQGATVMFDASATRIPVAQRVGMPTWVLPDGTSATGLTCQASFPVASRSRSDFKTVLLNWGGLETNRVIVYQLTPQLRALHQFAPNRDQAHFGGGEVVTLSFTTAPPVSIEEIGGLRWMVEKGPTFVWAAADDGIAVTQALGGAGAVKLVILRGLCRGCSVMNSRVEFCEAGDRPFPYYGAAISNPQPGLRRVRLGEGDDFPDSPYTNEMARITALTEASDLRGLEAFARELRVSAASNTNRYFDLTSGVIGVLCTYEFDLAQQFELGQTLARELFAWPGLPLGRRVWMLESMITDLSAELASAAWPALRKSKSEEFCRAWQECYAAVDWKYDPADPKNAMHWDSSIGGPFDEAREARRRADQVEMQRRHKIREEQFEAKHRFQDFAPTAERYLIRAYSRPPMATAELDQLLKTYVADFKTRERIKDEIAKRVDR